MTMQQTSPSTTAPKTHVLPTRLAISGALALLTVTAGVGTWQVTHSGSSKPATSVARPLTSDAGAAPAAASRGGSAGAVNQSQAAGAPVTAGPVLPVAHKSAAGPVIYLTASQEAGAAAESDLDAAAAIRRQSGGTAQLPQVAVVTSADGETQLRQTIADENQLRASLGLPDITIVDLRSAAPMSPASSVVPPSSRSGTPPVTYLVSSDEQARLMQVRLAEADAIRLTFGEAPNNADVVTVTGASDEAELRQAIDDLNAVRRGLGVPEVTLVDLRTPTGDSPSGRP